MPLQGNERRKFIRFPFNYPVLHRLKGSKEWNYSHSDNISFGGIEFPSALNYSEQDVLELKINFPAPSQNNCVFDAIVVSTTIIEKEWGESSLIRIQFSSVSPEQREFIEILLNERMDKLEEKKRDRL